jgi:hypothetical protein
VRCGREENTPEGHDNISRSRKTHIAQGEYIYGAGPGPHTFNHAAALAVITGEQYHSVERLSFDCDCVTAIIV